MKIPEPIIDPATIIVASKSVSDCLKEVACSDISWHISCQDKIISLNPTYAEAASGSFNKMK
jgi:hypothetical protein